MEIPNTVLAAVNEWFSGPYEEYKETYEIEECLGEVLCSNIPELHPDPNNIIIFVGINPGQDHGYTIEQNVMELNDILPENRRWYGWQNHYTAQIYHILQSIYPDRFVNDDNETIHRTVLYTNCSYFRTPRENGVVPVHINVSSTLVHNLINLVETPIFAFGKKSYRSVAQMLEMELVATTPTGWGRWQLFLYKNNSTNRKIVGMPHLAFPWATAQGVPENLWDVVRDFLEHDVVPEPQPQPVLSADEMEIRSFRVKIESLRTELESIRDTSNILILERQEELSSLTSDDPNHANVQMEIAVYMIHYYDEYVNIIKKMDEITYCFFSGSDFMPNHTL
jgi:hypothetical protein